MFSKIMTDRFTQSYSERIERAAQAIADSDAVLIGAGAGLSSAAVMPYTAYPGTELFFRHPEILPDGLPVIACQHLYFAYAMALSF